MLNQLTIICCVSLLFLAGCEDTDIRMATEAGLDAVKAVTLSDKDVQELAIQSVQYADSRHGIASAEDKYGKRLRRLIGNHLQEDELRFGCKVYLSDEVNAFAMANGTIRVYSRLMDMLDYGLSYLKRKGYDPKDAVSALRKLATLDNNHSFLSSHPAPGKRADRLALQLEGKAVSIEDSRSNLFDKATAYLERRFPNLYENLKLRCQNGKLFLRALSVEKVSERHLLIHRLLSV